MTPWNRDWCTADAAGLAVSRLLAVHELGTIDMFDHAGTSSLSEARRVAGDTRRG